MFLLILSAASVAYVFLRLTGICPHTLDVSSFPPRVPSFLLGYDNGLLYALNPCAFLSRCQRLCGSVYRVSLGSSRLVVVSSGDAISSVLSTPPQLLRNDVMHRETFYVVAGVESSFAHLHEIMIRELFPLVDRSLSLRSLGQTTRGFGLSLLSRIKDFTSKHREPIPLIQLTNEPLYSATNLMLLGNTFPRDTYKDFQILNQSTPYRFCRTLLWCWPSYAARMRLLESVQGYLERGEVANQFSYEFMNVFKENNIQSFEGAQLVLNFLWGVHSNTLSNSFFSLSFLLCNPDAFARVRGEIDSAVEMFGSLEALLEADPGELDDPSFKLLTSAIMETTRLTGLHAGIRQASCDFDLTLKDGTKIPIKEGEYVFANVRASHIGATTFPNPEVFLVDRFAQQPYRKRRLQTEGHHFYSLGGGRHPCKGRWLAVYEIKVLLIILLHMFDFSPATENSTGWCLPRIHPGSIGVIHTADNVFVRLSPRQVDGVM